MHDAFSAVAELLVTTNRHCSQLAQPQVESYTQFTSPTPTPTRRNSTIWSRLVGGTYELGISFHNIITLQKVITDERIELIFLKGGCTLGIVLHYAT